MNSQRLNLRNMRYKIVWPHFGGFALLTSLLLGCATPSSDVSFKKILPQQRFYVGRLKVSINGAPATKCEVYLNNDIVPSLQLAPDGLIVYKTDRENPQLKKLTCYRQINSGLAAWHFQKLPISSLLRPPDSQTVHYFGDILVTWRVDDQLASTMALEQQEDESRVKVARVEPSGDMKVEITSDAKGAERDWRTKSSQRPDLQFHFVESLVKLKHD